MDGKIDRGITAGHNGGDSEEESARGVWDDPATDASVRRRS